MQLSIQHIYRIYHTTSAGEYEHLGTIASVYILNPMDIAKTFPTWETLRQRECELRRRIRIRNLERYTFQGRDCRITN